MRQAVPTRNPLSLFSVKSFLTVLALHPQRCARSSGLNTGDVICIVVHSLSTCCSLARSVILPSLRLSSLFDWPFVFNWQAPQLGLCFNRTALLCCKKCRRESGCLVHPVTPRSHFNEQLFVSHFVVWFIAHASTRFQVGGVGYAATRGFLASCLLTPANHSNCLEYGW